MLAFTWNCVFTCPLTLPSNRHYILCSCPPTHQGAGYKTVNGHFKHALSSSVTGVADPDGIIWNILFPPVLLYRDFFLKYTTRPFFVTVRNYILLRHLRISQTKKTNVRRCVFVVSWMRFKLGQYWESFRNIFILNWNIMLYSNLNSSFI